MPEIHNPYERGMHILQWLIVLLIGITSIACALAAAGYIALWPILPAVGLIMLLACSLAALWVQQRWTMRRASEFLNSDRPFIRWTYTLDEWLPIQQAEEEEQAAGLVPLFGMALLLGLAGLLVGLLALAEGEMDDWLNPVVSPIIGALIGALIGGSIVVANWLGSRNRRGYDTPGIVALGRDELLYDGDYFRANGTMTYIEHVELTRDNPPLLIVRFYKPVIRGDSEHEWQIIVPARLYDRVQAILPRIRIGHYSSEYD